MEGFFVFPETSPTAGPLLENYADIFRHVHEDLSNRLALVQTCHTDGLSPCPSAHASQRTRAAGCRQLKCIPKNLGRLRIDGIHFKGRRTVPWECEVAVPKELTRLFLALSKGYHEDGPFLSFTDEDDEPVLPDARKILHLEATSEIMEEGWKEVIRENLEEDQTAKRTCQLVRVRPGCGKTTSPSKTRKSTQPR
jgi:hypothetical protein